MCHTAVAMELVVEVAGAVAVASGSRCTTSCALSSSNELTGGTCQHCCFHWHKSVKKITVGCLILAGKWWRYSERPRDSGRGIVEGGGIADTVYWQFWWRYIFFGGIMESTQNHLFSTHAHTHTLQHLPIFLVKIIFSNTHTQAHLYTHTVQHLPLFAVKIIFIQHTHRHIHTVQHLPIFLVKIIFPTHTHTHTHTHTLLSTCLQHLNHCFPTHAHTHTHTHCSALVFVSSENHFYPTTTHTHT